MQLRLVSTTLQLSRFGEGSAVCCLANNFSDRLVVCFFIIITISLTITRVSCSISQTVSSNYNPGSLTKAAAFVNLTISLYMEHTPHVSLRNILPNHSCSYSKCTQTSRPITRFTFQNHLCICSQSFLQSFKLMTFVCPVNFFYKVPQHN